MHQADRGAARVVGSVRFSSPHAIRCPFEVGLERLGREIGEPMLPRGLGAWLEKAWVELEPHRARLKVDLDLRSECFLEKLTREPGGQPTGREPERAGGRIDARPGRPSQARDQFGDLDLASRVDRDANSARARPVAGRHQAQGAKGDRRNEENPTSDNGSYVSFHGLTVPKAARNRSQDYYRGITRRFASPPSSMMPMGRRGLANTTGHGSLDSWETRASRIPRPNPELESQ